MPIFFSLRFNPSGFMLRTLSHFDFSFVWCDKYRSNCILLHADIYLDKQYFLKMLSFFLFYFWSVYQKSGTHMYIDLCLHLQLNFIDQYVHFSCRYMCFYYYRTVLQLEIGKGYTFSSFFFIFKDCFSYSVCSIFPCEAERCLFKVCEELCWNPHGNFVESVDCF